MKKLKLKFVILERFRCQSDFAFKVGCHESKVSQVLNGRRKLSKEQAEIWLKILECDPALISMVTK